MPRFSYDSGYDRYANGCKGIGNAMGMDRTPALSGRGTIDANCFPFSTHILLGKLMACDLSSFVFRLDLYSCIPS